MTAPIGRAYVEILPDMRSFSERVKASVTESTTAAKGSLQELNGTAASTASTVAHESEGLFSHLKNTIKETAAFALPALGGVELFKFFKESTDAARAEQKQLAQTAAVLKSTGGVAHVTAGHVEELAKNISLQTGITQTAIRSNENLLLTFTNVRDGVGKGNDIFSQATQTIQDLSVAMNESSRTATVQLGKALNDPVKGATALARVGVMLTDQQKAQIKAMVEGGQVAALNAEGMKVTQSQLDSLAAKYHGTAGAINYLTRQFTPAQKKQFEYYEQGNHLADAQKTILRELHHEFAGSAAAQATAGDKMSAAFEQFRVEVGNKLLPVIDAVENFVSTKLLPGIMKLFDEAQHGEGVFGALKNVFKAVWDILTPLVQQIIQLGKEAWPYVQRALAQVGPWLEKTAAWLKEHQTLVRTLVIAIGAFWVAWKGYTIIIAVKDAILGLNVAMEANPIGVVIAAIAALVAAFIYAYKHSETFRDIVNRVWNDVKAAALVFWHALQTIFHALQTAWNAAWAAVKWAWQNIGKPIWEVIKVAAKVLYAVVGGIFLLIINGWKAIWIAIKWAWQNIGKPIWTGIQVAAQFLWNNILKPIFNTIQTAWHGLWVAATAVWHTIIEPIWDGIKSGVQTVWKFIGPIFRAIGKAWAAVWSDMKSVFSTIWHGIESAIVTGINGIIHVINFFIRGIDWILSKLPGSLHINTIHTLSVPSDSSSGGSASYHPGFGAAEGGVVPGGGRGGRRGLMGVFPGFTPGRDIFRVPLGAFSGGEAILVPEATQGLGGPAGIRRINEYFMGRRGRRATHGGGFGMYAGGGTIDWNPNHIGGKITNTGAVDNGIGSWLSSATSSALTGAVDLATMIRQGVARALLAALNAAESPVHSAIDALPSGIMHDTVQGGFNTLDRPVRDAIMKFGGLARKRFAAAIARQVGGIPTGQHLALITQALQLAGVSGSAANIADVNTIIGYESGWNPNAINLTDSNAAAGDPSRGLMQTIMSTFEAYRLGSLSNNIYDPISNIVAGIRYAVSRYGSLSNVPGIVSLANGGKYVGYADGSWNIPSDQVAHVHQGEMILPKNIARYIRGLIAGGHPAQRDVPSASFSKQMHDAALAENADLKSMSQTLKDAWKGFVGAARDGKTHWRDFRSILHGLTKDLHLHGDALDRIQKAEQNIKDLVDKRVTAVHDLTHAENVLTNSEQRLASTRSAFHSQVRSLRQNILGGFDVTSAGAGGTDRFGNPAAISAGTIIGQLASTVQRAKQFGAVIRRLIKEGLPRVLVTQLAMAGPAAMAQAVALEDLTPHQLATLRTDYHDLGQAGTTLGRLVGNNNYRSRIDQEAKDEHTHQRRVHELERAVRRDDHAIVRAFRTALAGLSFEFDGDKVTLVVSQKQSHDARRGPRR